MQVKKSQVKSIILTTARIEFFTLGFQKTTMRSIAKKSAITTSNIYNYFKNKDDLFMKIVSPTLSRIMMALEKLEDVNVSGNINLGNYQSMKDQFIEVINFIDTHRQDLNLILFKSYGSNIQNFKENFIDRYTEIFMKQLKIIKSTRPNLNTEISRFFIHNLCSLYANIVAEVIMHNISFEKMNEYSKEFLTFFYYGTSALMRYDDKI
jgi:AcrR family transcriptional regulator